MPRILRSPFLASRNIRRAKRLAVEPLEDRLTPVILPPIVVDTPIDNFDGNFSAGQLSLREAVDMANNTAADTIIFAPALTASGPAVINLSMIGDTTFGPSALAVTSSILIQGSTGKFGVTIARDAAAAPDRLRLFYVTGSGNLTLQEVTLSGGLAKGGNGWGDGGGGAGLGGAVVNAGTLNLFRTTLTGNQATGGGSGGGAVGGGGGGLGGNGAGGGVGGGPNGGSAVNSVGFGGGGAGASGTSSGGIGGFGGGGGGANSAGNHIGGNGGFGGGGGFGSNAMGTSGFGGGTNVRDSSNFSNAGGGGAGLGGGVFNYGGTLTIADSTLANNSAVGGIGFPAGNGKGYGGAVFNLNGTVSVTNSTLAFNTASDRAGAIFNLGSGGENTQLGPALLVQPATVTINNSILAKSITAVTDFQAATYRGTGTGTAAQSSSGTNNLIQNAGLIDPIDGVSFVPFDGSYLFVDPLLVGTVPADNGGPTKTFALQPGSPAIDAGSNAAATAAGLTGDQRGFLRNAAGTTDIGAFETVPQVLVVDAQKDDIDGDYSAGQFSLPEAIFWANSSQDANTITFAPALTASGPATIALGFINDSTFGPTALAITSPITIAGPTGSSNGITIARNVNFAPVRLRLFYVAPAGSLTLQDLTISHGLAQGGTSAGGGGGAAGLGGAIVNAGTLNVIRSTLTQNQAFGGSGGSGRSSGGGGLGGDGESDTFPYGAGGAPNGGIGFNKPGGFGGGGSPGFDGVQAGGFGGGGGGGAASIGGPGGFGGGGGNSDYTEELNGGFGGGNGARGSGGGGGAGLGGAIFNYGGNITVNDSTFANNIAVGGSGANSGKGYGGAIFNLNGIVTLNNSTLANNGARDDGGAIYNYGSDTLATQTGPSLPTQKATVALANSILAGSNDAVIFTFPRDVLDYNASTEVGSSTAAQSSTWTNTVIQRNGGFTRTGMIIADPLLAPLDFYGAANKTFALRFGSPALDAATAAGSATDQRGILRPQGIGRDIGAFESRFALAVVAGNNRVADPNAAFETNLSVRIVSNDVVASGQSAIVPSPQTILFAANAGPSGASGAFAAGSSFTDANNIAVAPTLTANGTPGAFTVTASVGGLTATFNLTITGTPSVPLVEPPAPVPPGEPPTPIPPVQPPAPVPPVKQPVVVPPGVLPPIQPPGKPIVFAPANASIPVTVIDPVTKVERKIRVPLGEFAGPVGVAVGDTNGDGVSDIAFAAGAGGGPRVVVLSGRDEMVLLDLFVFETTFVGGVDIAVGDLDGDGFADLVAAAGPDGGPRVVVVSGKDGKIIRDFFAYEENFFGGVNVGLVDWDGDGRLDIVTGAGDGGAPLVRVFRFADLKQIDGFYAGNENDRGGVSVSGGDFGGTLGRAIVVGTGVGVTPPAVSIYRAGETTPFGQPYKVFEDTFARGFTLGVGNVVGDKTPEILVGAGPGGAPRVIALAAATGEYVLDEFEFDPTFLGGVAVS